MTVSEDTLFSGFSCLTEAFHESSLHLGAVQCASTIAPFCGLLESAQIPSTHSKEV